jgi:LEA14-like dessication related protein
MFTQARIITIIGLVILLGLSGCSSWTGADRREPQVHLLRVELVRAKLLQQKFKLHFRVDNPNHSSLHVRGLRYRVYLSDMLLTEGESSRWFTVEPHASKYFVVPVETNLWQHLRKAVKLLKKPDQPIPYVLEGELKTGILLRHNVHLSRKGEIIPGDLIHE